LAGIGAITEAIKIKPKNVAAIRVLKLLIFEKIQIFLLDEGL